METHMDSEEVEITVYNVIIIAFCIIIVLRLSAN